MISLHFQKLLYLTSVRWSRTPVAADEEPEREEEIPLHDPDKAARIKEKLEQEKQPCPTTQE